MPAIEVRSEAVIVREGRVLLVNHEKRGASYWVLPGGHVEHGETLVAALARELREELQVEAAIGALVLVHDYVTAGRHAVNHAFLAHASGDPRVTPQGSLKAAQWVPLAELERLDLRPPIAAILRQIAAAPRTETIYLPRA